MNSSDIWNIGLGVTSSAVSALLAWLVQTGLRRRRLERKRAFFGLHGGSEALLVVPRKAGTTDNDRVIAQMDAYALMELSALVYECGGQYTVQPAHQIRQGIGDRAEFCIAGPSVNERTAAHLKLKFPGFSHKTMDFVIGGETYLREPGVADHVLIARVAVGSQGQPTFLICGQTAVANLAAVRHLRHAYRELSHKHGTDSTFALLYKVLQPDNYGPDVIEFVADVTRQAQQAPAQALAPAPAG
ncbi:hypothetical protein ABH931_005971 [Streptacidiphilus sp. MAP12-33]|uniref:hypothetical protein n=1 Tax=Streptacidiphilus sp. MAP12-33 TaxID=3156266 RepID=UPI00351994D5